MTKLKFRTNAPFGVATKRFATIGFHPNLDTTGSMSKGKNQIAPGHYNAQRHECAYKKYNITGSPWSKKTETEEFSRELGFRNARILAERKFIKSLRGPGHTDIPEAYFKRQDDSCYRDASFGLQRRFRSIRANNNPPPGTYGKDISKTTTMAYRQFTDVPPFEWDGFIDRLKDTTPCWKPAPNRYDPIDRGSIAATLTKVVSKRGPYDCFTGPRDGTTIKNHFAPPTFKGPLNWFNTSPNELEILLTHPKKQLNGKFFKADRFLKKPTVRTMLNDISLCYRNPNDPGPSHYTLPSFAGDTKRNMYAFNTSVKDARPGTKWKIYPGVGRYNPRSPKCQAVQGESSSFKSKTGRDIYTVIEYNSF